MSRTHLIIPDQHANPNHNNDRALWLSYLIHDLKPDVVVNLGDGADMESLCSYDKGKKSFHGRTYYNDISSHLDFQEKLWSVPKKSKKRLPRTIYLIGNHEQRIQRAVDLSPELEGTISIDDLELREWYDEVVPYDGATPGVIEINGVHYAHYFVSGVMGRPISGEHPAYSLVTKRLCSSTAGHVHTADFCVRTNGDGRKVMGLIAGVYQDWRAPFAGGANDLWWSGVCYKKEVENGMYDLEFISMKQIKNAYS